MTDKDISTKFENHNLDDHNELLCQSIRHVARDLATCMNDLCPDCHEKDVAIDHLQMAVFFANAAIARQ